MTESIEKLHEQTKKKVIIISHSMGCPFTYYFLMQKGEKWVEEHVHLFIPTAPAWMGAVKSLKTMFKFKLFGDLIGSPGNFKEEQISEIERETSHPLTLLSRNIPTTWFLLPWNEAFKNKVIVEAGPNGEYTYTADKIVDVFKAVADDNFNPEAKLQSVRKYFDNCNKCKNYDTVPKVNMLFAIGTGKKTPIRLKFKQGLQKHEDPEDGWDDPEIINGNGDGTVPIESLTYVSNKWMAKDEGKDRVKVKYFQGETHLGIVEDKNYIKTVLSFACGQDYAKYDPNSNQ